MNKGDAFELTCGLRGAVQNGAQVINMSLGFWDSTVPIPLYNALKFAEDNGVLVVMSAGNEGKDLRDSVNELGQRIYRWPGAFQIIEEINQEQGLNLRPFSNLIVVASLDEMGQEVASYSNYNPNIVNVLTQGAFRTIGLNNEVVDLAGTSMTAGFVSKIVALALAHTPALRPRDIIDLLTDPANLKVNPIFEKAVSSRGRLAIESDDFYLNMGIPIVGDDFATEPPEDVVVSPNPFFKDIYFRLHDGSTSYSDLELKIYDLCGQLVYQKTCNGESVMHWDGSTTSGEDLPDGLYLYALRVNGKPFCGKVLKFWRN